MKTKSQATRLVLVLAAGLVLPAAAHAQGKPRVAVLGFENNSSFSYWGDRLGAAASDELTTQLVKTGAFAVIERQQVNALLDEQHAGASGAIDPATAAKIGKLLGAQVVLLGSITQFSVDQKSGGFGGFSASYSEAESKLDVRLVDTSTGEILFAGEGSGKKRFGGVAFKDLNASQSFDAGLAQEALRPAVEQAVEALLSQKDKLASLKPDDIANIVGAREGSIYIDRGENFGIAAGQRFDVMRVVDEIKDASGNVLDRVTNRVGVIEVTRVLSKSSICKLVEGDAKEGDTARPQSSASKE